MNSQYAACSSPTSRPAKSSPDPPHFPRVTRVTGIAEPQCGPNRVRPEHRPRDVGDGDVTRVALEVAVNAESLRSVTRVTPVTRRSWGRYGHCSGQVAAVQIGDRLRVKAFGPGSPTEASNLQARSCRSHCSNRAA